MFKALSAVGLGLLLFQFSVSPVLAHLRSLDLNARSAILIDMQTGDIIHEQDADLPIAPASLTKILSLYVVFEAVRNGEVHLWDEVYVSRKAAGTGGSRMGLRAGTLVPLEELIKGMAVVSGNDACVAVAEYMSGSVEAFVRRMNLKARELGMFNSVFMTPNGLPARGQVTTARDMAKLSLAYLRRFPNSLSIHSMQTYTYRDVTRKNANRLLGRCPGVDGLKTGFVCASGYNLSATAKRGDTRLVAVVMGASSPSIRACETARLLELGYQQVAPELADVKFAQALESGTAFKPPEAMTCRVEKRQDEVVAKGTRTARALAASSRGRKEAGGKAGKFAAAARGDSNSKFSTSRASRVVQPDSRSKTIVALKRPDGKSPPLITNKPEKIRTERAGVSLSKSKKEGGPSRAARPADSAPAKGFATAKAQKPVEASTRTAGQKGSDSTKGNQMKNREALKKSESESKSRQQVQGKPTKTGNVL